MLAGNLVDDHALRIFLLPVAARTTGAPETCHGDGDSNDALNDQEEIHLYPTDDDDLENVQRQGRQYLIDGQCEKQASQRAESSGGYGNVAEAARGGDEQREVRLAYGWFDCGLSLCCGHV